MPADTQTVPPMPPDEAATLPPEMRGANTQWDQASGLVGAGVQAAEKARASISKRNEGISAQIDELAQRKFDQPPPKIDMPAFQAPQMQEPMKAFGSFAGVLATLASLATRHPLTAALNAASAGMNAVRDGNAAAYTKAFTEWKTNSEFAFQKAQLETEQYRTAIDLYKTDSDMAMQRLRALAAMNQDDVMLAQIESGNVGSLINLVSSRESLGIQGARAQQEMAVQGERMNSYLMAKTAAQKSGTPWTPQQQIQYLNQFFPTTAGAAYLRESRRLTPASQAEVAQLKTAYDAAVRTRNTLITAKMGKMDDPSIVAASQQVDTALEAYQDAVQSLSMQGASGAAPQAGGQQKTYSVGDVIPGPNGKRYKVTKVDPAHPDDPYLEEVK